MLGSTMSRFRPSCAVGLACVAALGVAACGSSGAGSGAAGTQGISTPTQTGPDPVKVAADYTGGKAGKAADRSLAPVVIGWSNQDNSPFGDYAPITDAVNAAVDLINHELGGIDGHPVKIEACVNGQQESQGQVCAEKFLNDSAVQAAMLGEVIVGAKSMVAGMKGSDKIIVGGWAPTPESATQPNAFWTTGGFLTGTGTYTTFLTDYLKAKTVAQIWPSDPASQQFAATLAEQYKSAGIQSTAGFVPAQSSDVTGPVLASGAKTADAVTVFPSSAPQCIAMAKALTQIGAAKTPTLGFPICFDPSVKSALGDNPTWYYSQAYPNVNVPDPSGQVGSFLYALEKYGPKDESERRFVANAESTPMYFGIVLTLAKWYTEAGPDATGAQLAKVAKRFTGPVFLGEPALKFGVPPFTSIGAQGTRFYKYEGAGKWSDATNGHWVNPPAPAQ
jgi:branched-chain amino acid transport system substrate-binding protein